MSTGGGFALIITLVLMVLLTVLAVGLLSLSTLSLRTSKRESEVQVARSNARLALMLAIGNLQKELGPDRRITAPSGIFASADKDSASLAHPRLTGVWNSREDQLGRAPDYDRDTPFRGWLVSSDDPKALSRTNFVDKGSFKNPVRLVSGHDESDSVHAGGVDVTGKEGKVTGRLAWWVGDENCKGFTNPASGLDQENSPEIADILAASATPGAYGVQAVEKDFPSNTPEAAKVISHAQTSLAIKSRLDGQKHFHDLSPYPRSVLANVTKGMLREDLSLFLEQPSLDQPPAWPSTILTGPLGPNRKIALSDVDEYDVLSWKSLAHYSRLRNRVTLKDGRPTMTTHLSGVNVQPNELTNPTWNTGTLRPGPVMIRCLLFLSYGTIPDPVDPLKLMVRFYAYPVMTLWNPYNVDLMVPEYNMLWTGMPMEHELVVNGQVREVFDWRNGGSGNAVRPTVDKPLLLRAGEAKVLTPTRWNWLESVPIHHAHYMDAVPFRYSPSFAGGEWGNGNGSGRKESLIKVSGVAADSLEVRTKVKLFENGGTAYAAGGGYQSTFDIRGDHSKGDAAWLTYLWSSKVSWRYQMGSPSPDKLATGRATTPLGSLRNAPRPFMVMDAKLKALDETEFPNKTWADCIPGHSFQGATNVGGKTPFSASAYKLTFESINSYQEASSYLQVTPDDATHTYFGGSHFPQGGQSLITDIEIPLAPLTSLAQLQHLPQASIDNLYSSGFFMQNHAIGNSYASPGVPSSAVKGNRGFPFWVDMYMSNTGGSIRGEKFPKETFFERPNIDRSYAANHLLWDDYFFSSMAPKDGPLRPSGDKAAMGKVVRDFYENGKSLPNERYRPYLSRGAEGVITDLISRDRPTVTGYKKVAGALMVDGGFNINSVSVKAWKTLLASAHRKRMGIMDSMSGKPKVEPAANFVVSRFSMPNGGSAGAASGMSGESLRWTGYRELDEEQVDALANAIVRQVKLRGPFRSLGEFINRRLGAENDERTLYGALQAALEDPEVSINEDFRSEQITEADLVDTAYANRSAAMGSRYQGAPAYVSQADLLGPIAPVLNARSDTFLVRAYGEATSHDGTVIARAWCEAVVQRVPDYLDVTDLPELAAALLRSNVNRSFGRRFNVTSFRWLAAGEI